MRVKVPYDKLFRRHGEPLFVCGIACFEYRHEERTVLLLKFCHRGCLCQCNRIQVYVNDRDGVKDDFAIITHDIVFRELHLKPQSLVIETVQHITFQPVLENTGIGSLLKEVSVACLVCYSNQHTSRQFLKSLFPIFNDRQESG